MEIKYKRNEDKILEAIMSYINSTYSQHYAGKDGRDVCDDWEDAGIAKEAYHSNMIKYVKRLGKKEGYNPKDILKNIHYSIFLLHELERERRESNVDD